MALEAFYNLKDKKKENILSAISTCLKKMSYDEISVNNIVVEADISRGSFYNYFVDKNDAVRCLIESRVKHYINLYIDSIKESEYKFFVGTKKVYAKIVNILSIDINLTVMKNLKFFSEFVFETLKSQNYKDYFDEIIMWFVKNTVEGQNILNTKKKMSNVFDMVVILMLNSIFAETLINNKPFSKNSDFEYKLEIIEKGIF